MHADDNDRRHTVFALLRVQRLARECKEMVVTEDVRRRAVSDDEKVLRGVYLHVKFGATPSFFHAEGRTSYISLSSSSSMSPPG